MADNDSKRYYWLKLKKDFFQQHQMKVLKSLPNGRLYALIYLELLAESTSHEGRLRYSDTLPYDVVTLASVIDEDKDNLENAIKILQKLELLEVLSDETIYLQEVNKLIGSETFGAERKREYRENKDFLKGDIVPSLSPNCPQENRVKSKENRDKSKDNNIQLSKDNCMSDEVDELNPEYIKNLFNSTCKSFTPIEKITKDSKRYKFYRARLNEYGLDKVKQVLQNAENSDFLKGQSNNSFMADFEWMMRPNNFVKILENKYTNREYKNKLKEKELEIREREVAHKENIAEAYKKDIELKTKNNQGKSYEQMEYEIIKESMSHG